MSIVRKLVLGLVVIVGHLRAQTLVVDRRPPGRPAAQRIERRHEGFIGDFFRIGAAGEVWMMDSIRVWAIPGAGPACGKELGDSIEKLALLGALDNPPVPGQPVCDCHALVTLASVPLQNGSSASGNPNVKLAPHDGVWQIDFQNVLWSAPGGSDLLFTVRATARGRNACHADTAWSLAAAPAANSYRLHLLNEKGVPVGFAEPDPQPRTIAIQVWAHQTK